MNMNLLLLTPYYYYILYWKQIYYELQELGFGSLNNHFYSKVCFWYNFIADNMICDENLDSSLDFFYICIYVPIQFLNIPWLFKFEKAIIFYNHQCHMQKTFSYRSNGFWWTVVCKIDLTDKLRLLYMKRMCTYIHINSHIYTHIVCVVSAFI